MSSRITHVASKTRAGMKRTTIFPIIATVYFQVIEHRSHTLTDAAAKTASTRTSESLLVYRMCYTCTKTNMWHRRLRDVSAVTFHPGVRLFILFAGLRSHPHHPEMVRPGMGQPLGRVLLLGLLLSDSVTWSRQAGCCDSMGLCQWTWWDWRTRICFSKGKKDLKWVNKGEERVINTVLYCTFQDMLTWPELMWLHLNVLFSFSTSYYTQYVAAAWTHVNFCYPVGRPKSFHQF